MKQLAIKRILLTCFLLTFAAKAFAVTNPPDDLKLTDAYQVLALRRAEVKAELQFLNATLTGRHPDVLRKQDQLDSVTEEMDRLERSGKPFEKLRSSYGRLLLEKALVAAELKTLKRSFRSSHPLFIAKEAEWIALDSEAERIIK
jgi:hypothetical protein